MILWLAFFTTVMFSKYVEIGRRFRAVSREIERGYVS
jgi:dimeric dUTPase (all-alpha-NTP-PPase superfamily)